MSETAQKGGLDIGIVLRPDYEWLLKTNVKNTTPMGQAAIPIMASPPPWFCWQALSSLL